MLFHSIQFILFFAIVYWLYHRAKTLILQNSILLIASYIFYSAWDARFLSLIIVSTIYDYYIGYYIVQVNNQKTKTILLVLSIVLNISVLGFLKYYNFAINSFGQVFNLIGLNANLPTLEIILPIGISFFTFQKISYIVDIYRGETKPANNLWVFALYIAYFPQLVAGPIEKATHLLPQLQQKRTVTREDIRIGILWIITGYFKKIVIADTIAPYVDWAFDQPERVTGVTSIIAIIAFALQIYGDFAGYSLIARGISRLLGIYLMENFRMPYLARSPREFWNRWHISLSYWLKNYIYIPLGGNRTGTARTYLNLMITMLLAGLWHGANWTFVIWGGYHGILLIISHALKQHNPFNQSYFQYIKVGLEIGITFFVISIGWLLFRAKNFENLTQIILNIVNDFHIDAETYLYFSITLVLFSLLMIYHFIQWYKNNMLFLLETPKAIKDTAYVTMMICIISLGFKPIPFVYFQF